MPAYCQQHQSHYALKGTDEQTRGREGLPTGIGLAVFSEVGEGGLQEGLQGERSGVDAGRPELKRCLEYLREGDTLLVTKIDRLARSTLRNDPRSSS